MTMRRLAGSAIAKNGKLKARRFTKGVAAKLTLKVATNAARRRNIVMVPFTD